MSFLTKNGKLAGTLLASIAALLMINTPVFAIDQGGLISGGSIWLETTLAVALVFVTAMAFSLQIARGYFLRNLEKFTLRLGADIWWLGYVMIRDALIFLSFIMGLLVFFPGTFEDYGMAVPFMPVSVVFFGLALITKLYFDADENRRAFRAVTIFVFLGTFLWIFGTIFVTESAIQLPTLPAGVSSTDGFWAYLTTSFNSQYNPDLAMASFYVCMAALSLIGLFGFAHPMLQSRINKSTPKITQSSGPASPAGLPGRAAPHNSYVPVRVRPGQGAGFVQASTEPHRDHVDYIQ